MTRSIRRPAIVLSLWVVGVAGAAQAAEVYQGDDYSYGKDANLKLVVCDKEADGRGVHADGIAFDGHGVRVDDLDGAGGWCYQSNNIASGLGRHRTVEEISTWPDAKSAWSYH
jgi:hypothetical protein